DDAPPLWLWVIANPSTGKSDTIRHAYGLHRFTEFRDELTAKALSSGFREGGKRAKTLLDSLHRKTLCTPDLASTFSKDEATVKAILGTRVAAFDGPYDKSPGTDIDGPLHHVASSRGSRRPRRVRSRSTPRI